MSTTSTTLSFSPYAYWRLTQQLFPPSAKRVRLLVLDVETNGLSRVVELAAQLLTYEQEADVFVQTQTESFSKLLKPDGWSMSEHAIGIHGLTLEYLEKNGECMRAVLPKFVQDFVVPADVIVGHNILFDMRKLETEAGFYLSAEQAKLLCKTKPVFCTMNAFRDIMRLPQKGKASSFKIPSLREVMDMCLKVNVAQKYAHLSDMKAHRAMYDVLCTSEAMCALVDQVVNRKIWDKKEAARQVRQCKQLLSSREASVPLPTLLVERKQNVLYLEAMTRSYKRVLATRETIALSEAKKTSTKRKNKQEEEEEQVEEEEEEHDEHQEPSSKRRTVSSLSVSEVWDKLSPETQEKLKPCITFRIQQPTRKADEPCIRIKPRQTLDASPVSSQLGNSDLQDMILGLTYCQKEASKVLWNYQAEFLEAEKPKPGQSFADGQVKIQKSRSSSGEKKLVIWVDRDKVAEIQPLLTRQEQEMMRLVPRPAAKKK